MEEELNWNLLISFGGGDSHVAPLRVSAFRCSSHVLTQLTSCLD